MKCLDYLIWSLAQAEYATKDEGSMEHYEDMIIEVSRTLRELAAGLPENGESRGLSQPGVSRMLGMGCWTHRAQ